MRHEGFLHGPGADPAHEVRFASSLVIGTGFSTATEGLLADDCTGGFVIDIEVAGGMSEFSGGLDNG